MTKSICRWLAVLVTMYSFAPCSRADEPSRPASALEVKALINQLGSKRYKDRERASAHLAQIGKSVLGRLKDAANSPDLEVRQRALRLMRQIDPPPVHAIKPPIPPKSYL